MRVPTIFGRLAYLASLRDPSNGRYYHPVLSPALGSEEADTTLRKSHYQVFSQWLSFGLAEQKADLVEFLESAEARMEIGRYREFPPPTARDVERQLFITDLETVLELLRLSEAGPLAAEV
jgi:hypothetical protein